MWGLGQASQAAIFLDPFVSFISFVSTSICLCLFHQLHELLITFNHTYLKCIFIFTYILYAGKPSVGRLRLGRQWDGESVLPLTLTEQMDQKKAVFKSVSAISRRTYKRGLNKSWRAFSESWAASVSKQVISNLYIGITGARWWDDQHWFW